ncbi:NF-kappa-B essential modulator isoform 2-T2 [Rhinophrynus dorsalis]
MSVRGHFSDMVQPESSASECNLYDGEAGDSSFGKEEMLPPELTNHKAFQRLFVENQDLRTALEQSSVMLRKRHSEMLEFQESQRKEREFIMYKFGEARTLVLRLTEDRNSLQAQLDGARNQLAEIMAKGEREGGHADAERRHPEHITLTEQRLSKMGLSEEKETHEGEIRTETEILRGAVERITRTEQESQSRLQESEAKNSKLQQQVTDLQAVLSDLRRQMADRSTEAQKEVQSLQLQLEQLAEEKVSVIAQVTSLLGELKEKHKILESCVQEKRRLEESLRGTQEQQRDWEARVKQHVMQLDQRRMQVQSLEAALKIERQNASEEKRKLAQLQAAYHKLFQEYDSHIKVSLQQEKIGKEVGSQNQELNQQLQEAESALVAKQELIDKLKDEAEKQRSELETIPVLKAQVQIYIADFQAERKAREEIHAEKEKLQEQLDELLRERARIDEMRNRHTDNLRPSLLPGPHPALYAHTLPHAFHTEVEPQEFCCPKCMYKAPDMDTLQIHVMDCIQ